MEADQLEHHLMVECSMRAVDCPYCGIQKVAADMQPHLGMLLYSAAQCKLIQYTLFLADLIVCPGGMITTIQTIVAQGQNNVRTVAGVSC